MVQSISILGSTGSIGRQTIAAAGHLGIRVAAIAAHGSTALLEEQARRLHPELVAVTDEKAAGELRLALADTDIKVAGGDAALFEAAALPSADCVVTAVSGSVGLGPTLTAISEKKRIALANKETLVCAGDIVMSAASDCGAEIIPVDSEHSAIFQCLDGGRRRSELRKILLTASGGPFRGQTYAQTYDKTPAQAVSHPNWRMGAKISVDSATMMNKGLELMPDMVEILIHPQSIVHSAVELKDGAVLAQLGTPDMELPIQLALTYPERRESTVAPLDLFSAPELSFSRPELGELPCLKLAIDCAKRGGTAPCVLSAANEAAVGLFLEERICFGQIYECVQSALDSIDIIDGPTLEEILASDRRAKAYVKRKFG